MATQVSSIGAYAAVDSNQSKRHSRRDFTPDSAEASLECLNDHWEAVPGLSDKDAFNAFFAEAVAAYNEGKKRSRQIPADYYEHVAAQKVSGAAGRVLCEEVVLGAGDRDTVGVTDTDFDVDEWRAAKDRDAQAGIAPGASESEAARYVREHMMDAGALERAGCGFDLPRWHAAHAADKQAGRKLTDEASEERAYVDEFMGSATVMDRQRAALLLVRELWNERYPQLHLIRFDIHADEPNGTPHAHACYLPWTESGKNGPARKCSMRQALRDMGFKNTTGKGGSLAVEKLRADMRGLVRECYEEMGFEIEDKGIRRERVATKAYVDAMEKVDREARAKRAENEAAAARNAADAERNAAEARRNFRDAEQIIADAAELDARAEEVERAEAEADETRAAAERDAAETRREAQRAAVEGFERPKAVEDYLPEYGSKSNALVAYLTEQVKAQRAGEEPPTVHVPGTRELAEQRAALERQAAALMARENALGEREGEVDERERAVDAARADVERRERAVGTAEADVERELAGRRAKVRCLNDEIASKGARVERIDAELEAKGAESRRLDEANEARRAEAARLDAEADEKARWLEGAVEHVKEADAYVEQAKADAEATRRAAEADAERTRADARAEREEALRGLTDRAEERITGFLGRVVGDVGYIAYRTLSVMVEMGVGGERFASAARVCMDAINAMSEDAIGRPFSQTLSGRVQERVARSFARAFARRADEETAVPREAPDASQVDRSRGDGPAR